MAIHPILFNSKMVRIAKKPRLIDANALLDKLPKVDLDHDERITKSGAVADMIYLINNTPTIEAEPVRHGRWIPNWESADDANNMSYSCSCCGWSDLSGLKTAVPYCWHCGAKMDAKEDTQNDQG